MVKTLVVIDVQNDFCHPNGFFPQNFGSNTEGIDEIVDNIEEMVNIFREKRLPIIYTLAMGDKKYISKTQFERYSVMGKLGLLQEGEWGADFYRLKPVEEELVFKKGGYNPFSNQGFREHLTRNCDDIVLVGFYSDVCVRSTAEEADQLGIRTSVIADCSDTMTKMLHREALDFMRTYFGTIVYENVKELVRVLE